MSPCVFTSGAASGLVRIPVPPRALIWKKPLPKCLRLLSSSGVDYEALRIDAGRHVIKALPGAAGASSIHDLSPLLSESGTRTRN